MDDPSAAAAAALPLLVTEKSMESDAAAAVNETNPSDDEATADLEARITRLEQVRYSCSSSSSSSGSTVVVDDCMRRARTAVENGGCSIYSARWKWVPLDYYEQSLAQRAKLLKASSSKLLCKALLLENKKHIATSDNNIDDAMTNPKFIMVILQYDATLNVKKLQTAMMQAQHSSQQRGSTTATVTVTADFRVASSDDNDRLTGYPFNSVSPFGVLQQSKIRMVLAKAIVDETSFFWMGGGHVQLKLGMATRDFVAATTALVADISSPRTSAASSSGNADDDDDFE